MLFPMVSGDSQFVWSSLPVIGTSDLVYKLLSQISFVVLSIAQMGMLYLIERKPAKD